MENSGVRSSGVRSQEFRSQESGVRSSGVQEFRRKKEGVQEEEGRSSGVFLNCKLLCIGRTRFQCL
ncbi:hypothetical protein [Anabaena sp. 90]|uniref:hypothetical protein n=1 Tax=Anabaena sp. 90 TaxID=46234 RepID=UPI0002F61A7F|nr:hypothetical protein [Anabaena sp. 90]